MSQQILEGTWEEIVSHADELAGKRVRLTILEEAVHLRSDQPSSDEHAEAVEAIREGIESFRRGEGLPAREALEDLRQKHGISR